MRSAYIRAWLKKMRPKSFLSVNISFFFFFKQKTAYEITVRDWSSDVCSSDLPPDRNRQPGLVPGAADRLRRDRVDRKSVEKGKSVDCCVDLGGRRIIKKKKKKEEKKNSQKCRNNRLHLHKKKR